MRDFLRLLAQGALVEDPVALVVAHPDDEILGLGSRLSRLARLKIIQLTDGAPRHAAETGRDGCAGWRAYAALRDCELGHALQAAGADRAERLGYAHPDQEAIWHCAAIVERLAEHLADARVVVTHPYEHGHPDHDTAALSVALACERLRACGRRPPWRCEFASYHLRAGQGAYGVFWPDRGAPEVTISLLDGELARKRAAVACFASQRQVLANFPLGVERVRRAPHYDFRLPAPPGAALYDGYGWAINSTLWRAEASRVFERAR